MPLARKLWGHYLNGFTFPEVIRRYALSLERFSLSERLEPSYLESDPILKIAVARLETTDLMAMGAAEVLALMRMLVNEALSLPPIVEKITSDAESIQSVPIF